VNAYDCGLMLLCVRVLKVAGAGFIDRLTYPPPEYKKKFRGDF